MSSSHASFVSFPPESPQCVTDEHADMLEKYKLLERLSFDVATDNVLADEFYLQRGATREEMDEIFSELALFRPRLLPEEPPGTPKGKEILEYIENESDAGALAHDTRFYISGLVRPAHLPEPPNRDYIETGSLSGGRDYVRTRSSSGSFDEDTETVMHVRHDGGTTTPDWITVEQEHWWKFRTVVNIGGIRASLYKYVLPEHRLSLFPFCRACYETHRNGLCPEEERLRLAAKDWGSEHSTGVCERCGCTIGCYDGDLGSPNEDEVNTCNCTLDCLDC